MALKIRYKKLANGYEKPFLDIHQNGFRRYEYLEFKWMGNPKTLEEKRDRAERMKMVQIIARQRELELLNNEYEIKNEFDFQYDFVSYMDEYIKNLRIKDIKKFRSVRNLFIQFYGKKQIPCSEITEVLLRRFVQLLEHNLKGESPSNYFAKFKQMLKAATSDRHFRINPAGEIRVRKTQYLHKEILTFDEIAKLKITPLGNENVKSAFLFCCLTGLRFCDVKVLEWKNVFNDRLRVLQEKTQVPIQIPLSEDAKSLLPPKNEAGIVFQLPSHTACQKWLKRWMVEANIDKHISWHCARHAFGTNLIKYGVDVSVASKLLGHTNLANTQRYVNVSHEMKADAISKLPSF